MCSVFVSGDRDRLVSILLILNVQVEQEVSALIDEWQQTTGKTFSVYGQTFEDLVKKRQNEYVADKENEKILRVSFKFLSFKDVAARCDLFIM